MTCGVCSTIRNQFSRIMPRKVTMLRRPLPRDKAPGAGSEPAYTPVKTTVYTRIGNKKPGQS
jgi:hypothetical protein